MKMFLSGSIWVRLLSLVVLGLSLFLFAILSKNIPERINRGQLAKSAIKQLDAVRRPLLEIKALENQVLGNQILRSHDMYGVAGGAVPGADVNRLVSIDSNARDMFEHYLSLSQYDVKLFSLVQKFIQRYNQWILTERKVFEQLQHVDKEYYHQVELMKEADSLFLQTLDVLAEGEDPIHEDIEKGSNATRFIQITGSAFIVYLFFISLILQREAGRKIAHREEDLKITLRSIGDAVIATDINGRVARMNPVAEQLTGWSFDEAKGRPLGDIFIIENATTGERVKSPVDDVLQHGEIVGMANHTVLLSRDGNRYQVADSAAPIKNKDNVIRGVVLVFHDVTNVYETQQKVHEQITRLSDIFSASMDAIIAADENGTIVEWNAQAEIIFGWKRAEILGAYLHETIIPLPYRNRHLEGIERLKKTGQATMLGQRIEISALRKSGEEFPVELSISQLDRSEGLLFSAFVRDLTEIKAARQELILAATTFESHSGIMITDGNKIILRVNSAQEAISGYSAQEMIGNNPSMLRSDLQDEAFYKKMWSQINTTGGWTGELWNRKKDGSLYAEDLSITAVKDKIGNITHYVGTSSDITERKRAEEKIEQLAYYDELTDLANRRLLLNRLKHEISVATRHHTFGSLLYLDLDHFKNLNDALGHPVGDELLRQVAARLKELVRSGDTVSRLGGDEFVIMLPVMNDDVDKARVEASAVAEKARMRLSEAFDLEGYQYHLNTSIGIVVFPEDDDTPDDILKHADSALYLAKAEGRNTSRFYEATMQEDADARLALEKDIRNAMKNNELRLNYQPQVNIEGDIVGTEALLRWHHP
ncbi:MAG: PAS domain S-box protein, partial [Proteobacteria bacterium]|nr:PAS domain S-box protein [Pseudomonadota bacterium]